MTRAVLEVHVGSQTLVLAEADGRRTEYRISTSKHGVGETRGSFKTPRGRHVVRAKIGAGRPAGTVFVARRPTGELYSDELARLNPERDWILSRILWLSGLERGRNRLGDVDTMRRYIYIHGMPDREPVGVPGSIGCIRMRNRDVIEIFDKIEAGAVVTID